MLKKVLFAMPLSIFLGLSASATDWATEMFETTEHDFGSVARSAKAEFEFVLSNIYVEDVHIAGVRSSCGCTHATIKQPTLKTYEKGAIVASINTKAFLGHKGATITVTFDKPYYGEAQLHVRSFIRSDVVVEPGSVELGSVDQGTAADKAVSVNHTGGYNWAITGVKSANPHVSANVEEIERNGGQVSYKLSVHLDENAPAGYIKDHLILVTNDHNSPEVPVLVEGRVMTGVTVSPASLFMGVVKPGQEVTKQLVVRGKKPFRILSVSCEQGCFKFGASDQQQLKTVHLVPVTFVGGDESGKIVRTIRIVTDSGEAVPELSAYAMVSKKQ